MKVSKEMKRRIDMVALFAVQEGEARYNLADTLNDIKFGDKLAKEWASDYKSFAKFAEAEIVIPHLSGRNSLNGRTLDNYADVFHYVWARAELASLPYFKAQAILRACKKDGDAICNAVKNGDLDVAKLDRKALKEACNAIAGIEEGGNGSGSGKGGSDKKDGASGDDVGEISLYDAIGSIVREIEGGVYNNDHKRILDAVERLKGVRVRVKAN